jgi:uncharacterized protein (DUF58 family)
LSIQDKYKPVFTVNLKNRTLQLTREGAGFIFLAFAVGIGAINTGNNLLYLILAMCCSFIALSGILSEATLRDISIHVEAPNTLYAEDLNPLKLIVTNLKKKIPSFSLNIEITPSAESRLQINEQIHIYHLPAGGEIIKSIMITPLRRGYLSINNCKMITSFPFGFFVKSKTIDIHADALVFPPIRNVSIPSPSDLSPEGQGEVKQSGDELSSLREFRQGDPISAVYWKASAKTGSLRVKEFSGGGHKSFTIFLNILDSENGNFVDAEVMEKRIIESASLAYHLIRDGNEVKFKTHDFETDFGLSEKHLESIMRYLALVGDKSNEK